MAYNQIKNNIKRLVKGQKLGEQKFSGGIVPPSMKKQSLQGELKTAKIPSQLIYPTECYNSVPLVAVKDYVLKYQLIAKANFGSGMNTHASTSGTVTAIKKVPVALSENNFTLSTAIIIKPDGKDKSIKLSNKHSGDLTEIVHSAGLMGMGGGGFISANKIKFAIQNKSLHTLIVNGAECEPFISCDAAFMQNYMPDIISGALILANYLKISNIIVGIEINKSKAITNTIALLDKLTEKSGSKMKIGSNEIIYEINNNSLNNITIAKPIKVNLHFLPIVYPMGSERQLIKHTTGVLINKDELTLNYGFLMFNVATLAGIYRMMQFGEPSVQRVVTINGNAISNPKNIIALIGTPIQELIKSYKTCDSPEIKIGGAFMGWKLPTTQSPVLKTTNCILINKPVQTKQVLPCIRCGECMDVCPANLAPQQLFWYAQAKDWDKMTEYRLDHCIECRACDYVCPSNIPLTDYFISAKSQIKANASSKQKTSNAKLRFEQRNARQEREKLERKEKMKLAQAKAEQKLKEIENAIAKKNNGND